ncbi:hypothetical protein [Shouchella hunanensis]|uniref:Uncharacterized protein n=1 Tax=Shouchella hunanensis TaxID=766894 RepID=A0ABY7W4B9_9BACI|nr:hypothetical protein [Shouchella hunanensis]WDF02755.1 hypothetical protein PQ477_14765 [Shouchella hunanensis]
MDWYKRLSKHKFNNSLYFDHFLDLVNAELKKYNADEMVAIEEVSAENQIYILAVLNNRFLEFSTDIINGNDFELVTRSYPLKNIKETKKTVNVINNNQNQAETSDEEFQFSFERSQINYTIKNDLAQFEGLLEYAHYKADNLVQSHREADLYKIMNLIVSY